MPLTPATFRRLALSLPGAVERAHMGHPDFRVTGRVFATLGYPDSACGMIKLAPEDQAFLLRSHGLAFRPAAVTARPPFCEDHAPPDGARDGLAALAAALQLIGGPLDGAVPFLMHGGLHRAEVLNTRLSLRDFDRRGVLHDTGAHPG
jgi:hypothetical protein